MKIKFILFLIFSVWFASCTDSTVENNNTDNTNALLQNMTDSLTNYYQSQYNITEGGFFLKIATAADNFFVSSNVSSDFNSDYHYRIASITKTFTAASIMLLHQQGKINIYDNITMNMPGTNSPYVPDDANWNLPFKDQITIELLLQHRAGVFDLKNQIIPANLQQPYAGRFYADYVRGLPGNNEHTFTFDELAGIGSLKNLYNFAPNPNEYHYSNTGYSTLGKIIERASGMTYTEFLRQNFFIPLELNNTFSPWNGSDMQIPSPGIASYLYENGSMIITAQDNMSANVAEGNLISSPSDVAKWINLLLKGNAGVNKANVELMKQVLPTGTGGDAYGLGIAYIPGLGYGHNGAHLSYMDIAAFNPDTGNTMLVGSNFMYVAGLAEQITSMANLVKSGLTVVR
ncbi:MAG TPA: serine hydrolase domain-containing protein [Ignavibacteria bacterium]|nr:serine hydrolase domain-containing protein [Ignavibacteria bacterium]